MLAFCAAVLAACSPDPLPLEQVEGSEDQLVGFVDEVRDVAFQSEFLVDYLAAECMRSHGFEYWPYPLTDGEIPNGDIAITDFSSSDDYWAAVESAEVVESGHDWGPGGDPNVDYFEKLDAATQDAYDEALIGDIFGGDSVVVETSVGSVQISATGCLAEARWSLLNGESGVVLLERVRADLEDTLFELDSKVEATDEYAQGSAEIDSCLRSRGFEYQDAQMRIRSFISTTNGVEGTEAIFACAQELDTRNRLQLIEDQVAREMLSSSEFETLLLEWRESRDGYVTEIRKAERELLSG